VALDLVVFIGGNEDAEGVYVVVGYTCSMCNVKNRHDGREDGEDFD
jgi:hypothetical protein